MNYLNPYGRYWGIFSTAKEQEAGKVTTHKLFLSGALPTSAIDKLISPGYQIPANFLLIKL